MHRESCKTTLMQAPFSEWIVIGVKRNIQQVMQMQDSHCAGHVVGYDLE